MQSGTEKRAALAYAASQGWTPPGEEMLGGTPREHTESVGEKARLEAKVADLERQLADATALGRGFAGSLAQNVPALQAKVADLEVALAAERESHQVTKKALERARRKGRVGELEKALAKLASDDVTEADLDAAKALLK